LTVTTLPRRPVDRRANDREIANSGGCRRVCIGVPALAHPPAGTEKARQAAVEGMRDPAVLGAIRQRELGWCMQPPREEQEVEVVRGARARRIGG